MMNPSYWGVIEYSVIVLLLMYFIRGMFRPTSKSVLSLILFPITMMAYVLVPVYMGYHVFLLENFLGLFKLLFVSFVLVTLTRWIVYFIFGRILTLHFHEKGFTRIIKRFPGALISCVEGLLLIICIFWYLDYLDSMFSKKYPEFYQNICRNVIYNKVNAVNPIYDLEGAKSFKCVLTTLSSPSVMEKFVESEVFRKFDNLPVIRNILSDTDFQKVIKENHFKDLLMNPLTFQLLKSSDLFMLVTSNEFIQGCRSALTPMQVKLIDEREGLFADMTLNFRNKTNYPLRKTIGESVFKSDTRIVLNNGFNVEGKMISQDAQGVLILLPEGQMRIKKDEILSIQNISNN